ncbi:MAG: hypothetical protein IT291_10690 [Deltaproteobacteria bacterium]|nr:hypothetical protein [Deltaproteobacteria bacterium]
MDNVISHAVERSGFRPMVGALPIDCGLAFAFSHKWSLIRLAIVPLLLEILASYVANSSNLARPAWLLGVVIPAISSVWVFSAVLMLAVDELRNETKPLWEVIKRSFFYMPKAFISYSVVVSIVVVGLYPLVVPGFLFFCFFMWAPAFCVGEAYCHKGKESETEELEEEGQVLLSRNKAKKYFCNLFPWDLGLVRSSRLVTKHLSTTVQLSLILLAGLVVPIALIGVATASSGQMFAVVIREGLLSLVGVFITAIWAGTFLNILPTEALREIGIVEPRGREILLKNGLASRFCRVQGRWIPSVILLLLTVISAWSMVQQSVKLSQVPASAKVDVASAEIKESEFVLTLHLRDEEQNFRWLAPERFMVAVNSAQPLSAESTSVFPTDETVSEGARIAPHQAVLFGQDGAILPYVHPAHRMGELQLVLHFERSKLPIEEDSNFSLYYKTILGDGSKLYQGSLNKNW